MLWSENLCSFPLTCLVFGARVRRGGERIYVSANLLCLLQPGKRDGLALTKPWSVSLEVPLYAEQPRLGLLYTIRIGWSGVLSGLPRLPFPLPFSMSPQGDNQKDLSLCLPLLTISNGEVTNCPHRNCYQKELTWLNFGESFSLMAEVPGTRDSRHTL